MRLVISYDIASSRVRTKVAHILEGYAERVQRSVFEGEMVPTMAAKLRRRLSRSPLGPEDSIRYYVVCQACTKQAAVQGAGAKVRAARYFVV